MTQPRRPALLLLPLLLWLAGGPAHAGGARELTVLGAEGFAAGTLERLALGGDGILRLGLDSEAEPLDASTAWAALEHAGALWIGTGNAGQILRRPATGAPARVDVPGALMVTALAGLPDGAVAAAVFPGGRLLRVTPAGEVAPLATLPVEHVWALVADARGGLTAACGSPGTLYGVDPLGAVTRLFEVGDEHARCLLRRGEEWLVGTAPKGLVLALGPTGRRVLRELKAQEVVGLVALDDGALLVAANADTAGGNAQRLAQALRQVATPSGTDAGEEAPGREALQDGSVFLLEQSGVLTPLWEEKKVAALTLVPHGVGAAVGTYPAGRVFGVAPGRAAALLADLPEAEASVLLPGLTGVVTSNPAVLHRIRPATAGRFVSAPLDGDAPSRWGRLVAEGRGIEGLEVRSAETSEPEDGWSPWQPVADLAAGAGTAGVTGRFLQVRVALAGPDAELRALSVVLRTPNRAPTVRDLEAQHEGSAKGGALPTASPVLQVRWKAEDPDGDALRVTLKARREGAGHWRPLLEDADMEKSEHAWDTTGWPDGRYEIHLAVSDAPANAAGEARTAEARRPFVQVDNTAPRVRVGARRSGPGRVTVEGQADDGPGGRVLQVRATTDGKTWVLLAAGDGLLDGAVEAFRGDLDAPAQGPVDVLVQVLDARGNLGAAAATVP